MSRLQWRANNFNENGEHDTEYYRIDFDTPTITENSRFMLYHSNYNPPTVASNYVPAHTWYVIAPIDEPYFIRNAEHRLILGRFFANHLSVSEDCSNVLRFIIRILQIPADPTYNARSREIREQIYRNLQILGVPYDAGNKKTKKYKNKKSRSRKSRNRKSRSRKSRSRRSRNRRSK